MNRYHIMQQSDGSQAIVNGDAASLAEDLLNNYIDSAKAIHGLLVKHASGSQNLIYKIVEEYNLLVEDLCWGIGELSTAHQEKVLKFIGLYDLHEAIVANGIKVTIRPS